MLADFSKFRSITIASVATLEANDSGGIYAGITVIPAAVRINLFPRSHFSISTAMSAQDGDVLVAIAGSDQFGTTLFLCVRALHMDHKGVLLADFHVLSPRDFHDHSPTPGF